MNVKVVLKLFADIINHSRLEKKCTTYIVIPNLLFTKSGGVAELIAHLPPVPKLPSSNPST